MKFKIIKFKNINSTNTKAIELIKKGKTLPTILTAEKQTKGRGRYGRKWKSQKGNLFMSIYHQLYSNISKKKTSRRGWSLIWNSNKWRCSRSCKRSY